MEKVHRLRGRFCPLAGGISWCERQPAAETHRPLICRKMRNFERIAITPLQWPLHRHRSVAAKFVMGGGIFENGILTQDRGLPEAASCQIAPLPPWQHAACTTRRAVWNGSCRDNESSVIAAPIAPALFNGKNQRKRNLPTKRNLLISL